jgi:methionyl-tRNA synthetase
MEKFYVTTAIYYVNDNPHIGSISEAISADVIARYKRLRNFDVFFSTGTDEHSQKIENRARNEGIDPEEFIYKASRRWKEVFNKFKISYDRFIRTSDADHIQVVQDFFKKMYEKGDIYIGKYEGWYCIRDETFLKDSDLVEGKCPYCGGEVTRISEDNYFFKLSKYQEPLLKFYEENKDFLLPESRYNEIVNVLKSGLQDISVTRKSFKFGVPVPFDKEHVVYVWFDALINYVTSVGILSDRDKFSHYWPADLHIIGKDITRFHCIIWPAMLLSYGLPLPKHIFAHGFWDFEGAKMSKSLGNVVNPEEFVEKLSNIASVDQDTAVDVLRYYLSREINFGFDADFKIDTFFGRYNSDLANDYGNLINRTVSMLHKYRGGVVPTNHSVIDTDLISFIDKKVNEYFSLVDNYNLSGGLEAVWGIIDYMNNYIQVKTPWKLEGENEKLDEVLFNLLEAIRIATLMLAPYLPYVSKKVLDYLNFPVSTFDDLSWGKFRTGSHIEKFAPIFPRIEKDRIELAKSGSETKETSSKANISYDDFDKIDLRVAKVIGAERVEKSEKLVKLTLKVGDDERIVVAGIGKPYSPIELIGKKIVIIANLEPRKLMGITSNGMLLAASNDNSLSLLTVDRDIEEGTSIH